MAVGSSKLPPYFISAKPSGKAMPEMLHIGASTNAQVERTARGARRMKGGTMYLRRRASDICFSVSEREIKLQASNQSIKKSPFAEKNGICSRENRALWLLRPSKSLV
jgi:hypothetical protein